MALDWRNTLKTLLPQFESQAAKSPGLHHLFVEVSDAERQKMFGPPWFKPFSDKVKVVDGDICYTKWDCCGSHGMPEVSPGFREVSDEETFDPDTAGVIFDRSGVPRAVATPMKLRQGFFCGQSGEVADSFKSLAEAAVAAFAGAADIDQHAFATDLKDVFRRPRGGVRYVFGDVPKAEVPEYFIAQGWSAGCLQFENGVLIDLPISESSPDSSHWLFLLHRLGWHQVEGCGLKAKRWAWDEEAEFALEMLTRDLHLYPEEFTSRFSKVSADSFYSVLGSKEHPLDINLASVFAIQLLLADLEIKTRNVPVEKEALIDYSKEEWHKLELPKIESATQDESQRNCCPKVGIIVATEVERQAVLKKMRPPQNADSVLQVYSGNNTCFVGRLGVTDVVMCMASMGALGRDSAMMVAPEIIKSWELRFLISAGIAFGKDSSKQSIGNVLVSERVISYEPERIGETHSEDRGEQPKAGKLLLNRFQNVIGWNFTNPNGQQCGFQVGPILAGEKLVDDPDFKCKLFTRFPTAIGGEMEGVGISAAAERNDCEWIIVKAICDWADGAKSKHHQEFAAAASVSLIEHVLNQVGAIESQ